jgi:hypothetical protein
MAQHLEFPSRAPTDEQINTVGAHGLESGNIFGMTV